MDPDLPQVPVLYNYDVDRDGSPGLVIARGGSGPDEGDPTKYQAWRAPPFSEAVVIRGDAKVHLWSAMKDFSTGLGGAVTVYLLDCEGWDCVELGSDTFEDANWQGGKESWVQKTFSVPIGTYTLAPGHSLELVVVVDASSDDDMWFAYDTGPYRSRVTVSASTAATAGEGELAPSLLAGWLPRTWARLLLT
jgi:hypothetical protein